jgi:hypothetical protein
MMLIAPLRSRIAYATSWIELMPLVLAAAM